METIRSHVLTDGSEQVPYNDPDFPVYAGEGTLKELPGMSFVYHWHDDWEFGIVLSGHMSYMINEKTVEVGPGETIFINSRQMHKNYSADGSDCHYLCFMFNPGSFTDNYGIFSESVDKISSCESQSFHIFKATDEKTEAFLKVLKETYDKVLNESSGYRLAVLSCISFITEHFINNLPLLDSPFQIDKRVPVLRSMVGYIQTHYSEKITLKDIYTAGNVSSRTCYNIFETNLHTTPMDYLMKYRLEKSIDLLRKPGLSITDVAYESGFSGVSYYTECFHKHFNMTPRDFRNGKGI